MCLVWSGDCPHATHGRPPVLMAAAAPWEVIPASDEESMGHSGHGSDGSILSGTGSDEADDGARLWASPTAGGTPSGPTTTPTTTTPTTTQSSCWSGDLAPPPVSRALRWWRRNQADMMSSLTSPPPLSQPTPPEPAPSADAAAAPVTSPGRATTPSARTNTEPTVGSHLLDSPTVPPKPQQPCPSHDRTTQGPRFLRDGMTNTRCHRRRRRRRRVFAFFEDSYDHPCPRTHGPFALLRVRAPWKGCSNVRAGVGGGGGAGVGGAALTGAAGSGGGVDVSARVHDSKVMAVHRQGDVKVSLEQAALRRRMSLFTSKRVESWSASMVRR